MVLTVPHLLWATLHPLGQGKSMMRLSIALLAAAESLLLASPARAGGCPDDEQRRCPAPVPEPSDFALFAGGLAGLLIGRTLARKRANGTSTGDERD